MVWAAEGALPSISTIGRLVPIRAGTPPAAWMPGAALMLRPDLAPPGRPRCATPAPGRSSRVIPGYDGTPDRRPGLQLPHDPRPRRVGCAAPRSTPVHPFRQQRGGLGPLPAAPRRPRHPPLGALAPLPDKERPGRPVQSHPPGTVRGLPRELLFDDLASFNRKLADWVLADHTVLPHHSLGCQSPVLCRI